MSSSSPTVVGVVVALGILAGCTAAPAADPPHSGEVPAFAGPWAAEFADVYTWTTTDFERAALADGVISDQELAEVRNRMTSCLTALGFSEIEFGPDGSLSLMPPGGYDEDTTGDQMLDCSTESGEGTVGALHSWIRRNPQNLDEDTIMAACLVREGVVDPSYDAAAYAEDSTNGTIPFIDPAAGQVADMKCNHDPLGLFG